MSKTKTSWNRTILWLVLLAAFVALQWPMLKGSYYKYTSTETAVSAVEWRAGLDAASAESRESGKPLLLVFTASWCPPCIVMKNEVWPDARVAEAVHRNAVPLLVDVDLPANESLVRRYRVASIPTILLVDANGGVLRQANFMDATATMEFVGQP